MGGQFHLALTPVVGQPLLSALLLTPKFDRVARANHWQLVWQDMFDDPQLNPNQLNVDIWPPGQVNNEDQAYTKSPGNLRIENGRLVLEAYHLPGKVPDFTSARVHTQGNHDFLYGRVEVSAHLPDAQGT